MNWDICVCVLSHFSRVWLFVTLWTSSPGSSVHGILQARILKFEPASLISSTLARRFFIISSIWEAWDIHGPSTNLNSFACNLFFPSLCPWFPASFSGPFPTPLRLPFNDCVQASPVPLPRILVTGNTNSSLPHEPQILPTISLGHPYSMYLTHPNIFLPQTKNHGSLLLRKLVLLSETCISLSDPTLYLLVQARIPGVPPHSPFPLSPVTPNHLASNPTDSPARLHVSNYADPALDVTHIPSQLAADTSLCLQVDLLEYIIPFLLEGFF